MYPTTSILGSIWKLKDFDERQSLMISQRHNIPPLIAKLLNIQHFSTIVFYKNGKEVARGIGDTNKSRIYSLLKQLIPFGLKTSQIRRCH